MTKHIVVLMMAASMVSVLCAENGAEGARGPWRWAIGPGWRTGMKASVKGTSQGAGLLNGATITPDGHGFADWNGSGAVNAPSLTDTKPDPIYNDPYPYLQVQRAVGGGGARDDHESGMGLATSLAYDFWGNDAFVLAAKLSFAAYLDMKQTLQGGAGGIWQETYLFSDDGEGDFTKNPVFVNPVESTLVAGTVGSAVRFKSSLYQLGFGPEFIWNATKDLHLGLNPELLLNLARVDMSTGAGRTADTKCAFGAALRGSVRYDLTERLFLTGSVGYEYVDDIDVRFGATKAEIDYSALTIMLGVGLNF